MRSVLPALLLAAILSGCGTEATPPRPTIPPLDHARHGHRLHRLDDLLVCVGGFGDPGAPGREMEHTWLLDLTAPEPAWVRGPDLHAGKAFFGSDVVDGAVVAVGRGGFERFDPATRRWTVLDADMSFPETHHAAVAVGGVLHVLGGYPPEAGRGRTFDPATGRSADLPPLPEHEAGDHLPIAVRLDGALHVVGGLVDGGAHPSIRHYRLEDGTWRARAPAPHPLWAKFAAYGVIDGCLYVFSETGGLRYDPSEDAWSPRAALPTALLAMPASVVLDSRLVVLGGMVPGQAPAPAVRIYESRTDRWH